MTACVSYTKLEKSISENRATDWISVSVIDQTKLADSEDRHCGLERAAT